MQTLESNLADEATATISKRKRWLFRFGAIFVGMLPFVLLELSLIFLGWQEPGGVADPFVGFTEIRPLFELNENKQRFEIASTRLPLFQADSFLAAKPADEFRIFCVGGSTVQGRPFSIETAFSKWLELSLDAADDSREWKVVNCGGVSYASYRLAPIIDEILNYEPDLIVLYTGHNEFLEDRTYESVKSTPRWVSRTHERLSSFRSYRFVRSSFVTNPMVSNPENSLPSEVEARLDFKNGLDEYSRDDSWKENVVIHFEHNLRRMTKAVQKTGVPLILMNPVCNLRDASPFKSEHASAMTTEEIEKFNQVHGDFVKGMDAKSDRDPQEDIQFLQSLADSNSRYAQLQYELGQAYQKAGDYRQAKFHLVRAKEEDVCPLRITEPLYKVIDQARRDLDIPLVDVKAFFESLSKDGIPGSEMLVDHVHPTIHGHQLIGELLIEEMLKQGMLKKAIGYEAERDVKFKAHLESLDFMYFQRGQDRLAGLKRWAEGKVTKEKKGPLVGAAEE